VTAAPAAAAFDLEGAVVEFGRTMALAGVTLQIRAGEAIAVVGPSGSGKTTLLRLLNGSVRPTEGRVLVDGTPLASMSATQLRHVRASIGFVHQDLRLVPNLRVVQNVVAGRLGQMSFLQSLRAMLLAPRALAMEVHQVLERVGIPEKLYERTDRLSGGQRQRVAIARALFQQPVALLADEPVSSVDPARARDALQLLTALSHERGLTLCVSLHHLALAQEFFPRLVGLRRGRIVFDSPTNDLHAEQFDGLYELDAAEMLEDRG
jgi:phosphonate transport system ATP-binding protein